MNRTHRRDGRQTLEIIYSRYCQCWRRGEFDRLAGIDWLELDGYWDRAVRLGVIRLPAIIDNDTVVAQGAVALQWLREREQHA